MATVASTKHRPRGLVKTTVRWICDASGVASATAVVGAGYGKLVAVTLPMSQLRLGSVGNVIVTVKDEATGTTILTYDTDALKFGNTTTGDASGGAAEDLFTTGAAHGLAAGDIIRFFALTGGTGLAVDTDYYVSNDASLAATTFRLAANAADAAAGTPVVNFTTDVTASSWVKVGTSSGSYGSGSPRFRPSAVVRDATGTAITAHANNPNVNRDINVFGSITVSVAQGGNLGEGAIEFLVDELGIPSQQVPQ